MHNHWQQEPQAAHPATHHQFAGAAAGHHNQQHLQQQDMLVMQQQQKQHARLSPFSMPAHQQLLDELAAKGGLARASCPGLLVLQEQDSAESEQDCMQLTSMLSSSWCDSSSMSLSRQSCSTNSMRSFTSSPLQHHPFQPEHAGLLPHQEHLQQLLHRRLQDHPQQLPHHQHQLPLHHHQQHHQHVLAGPVRPDPCAPCSPCCSASSEFGDLCCCKVLGCSSRGASNMSLAASADDSSCGHCAGVRAGSSSSAHSSNTACSDGSHCSSGAATVATEDCSAADAAADLLCRTYSSCSACSNKSHHVESRPAPGGDLALGSSLSSWILRDFGGKEVLAEFEFGQTLGCGTFGVTRLVTHRKTASMWACKSICKASIAASPAAQSDVQHEVQILQHLRGHNGIVQLKGAYEDERNIHLVMELCTGGDLLDYISRFQRLQEDEAADVASVMLSTLAHCHRLGIVHRDIKPENFLLGAPTLLNAPAGTAAKVLKISDFGVSAFYRPGERFSEIVGTPFYMAPEVLARCYGPEADVWSVGVVVFLMLAGRLPFDGATDRQIIKAVLDSEPDFSHPAWNGISAAAKDCVARMLVKDPQQRATVQQLLAHPWLAGRMRSSCCSNAGDTAVAGPLAAAGGCLACSGRPAAAGGCQHAAASGGRTCGVSWAPELVSTCCVSPRERRDSSPTPRKPVLSPLKHVKSRADMQ